MIPAKPSPPPEARARANCCSANSTPISPAWSSPVPSHEASPDSRAVFNICENNSASNWLAASLIFEGGETALGLVEIWDGSAMESITR
jgi:hypothetical protein